MDVENSILEDVFNVGVIGRLLDRAAAKDAVHVAVIAESSRVTYLELLQESRYIARGLISGGVERGDHVGIYMPNGLRFIQSLFGALMAGAVVVPIHSRFRSDEIRHLVRHGDLKVLLTNGSVSEVDHPARLHDALSELIQSDGLGNITSAAFPELRYIVAFDAENVPSGFVDQETFTSVANTSTDDEVEVRQRMVRTDDEAMILYTSGTTAHPKGCVHTHKGLLRNGITMAHSRFFLTSQDRFWDPLPMFHVGFLLPLIAVMNAGATILVMSKMDGAKALEMIEHERATWLFPAFPAIANALLDDPSFANRNLGCVRMTMCTGTEPMLSRLQAAIPGSVQISTYGSTETGGVVVYNLPSESAQLRATTCGTPMPGIEVQILDTDSGGIAAPAIMGEILVRGYSILTRYFKDDEATKRAIDAEGWLHTGDLGTLDDGGQLTYRGRLNEMLKVGGENVSPLEVETLIGEMPNVAMVQIVGVEDDRLGEVVVAFIETRGESRLTQDDVIRHCTARIAQFKIPRHVRFVSEWPMSATKVNKAELKKLIASQLTDDRQNDTSALA